MIVVLAEDPLSCARRVACTALVTYVSSDRRQLPFVTPGASNFPREFGPVISVSHAKCAETDEEWGQWVNAGTRRRVRLETGENNKVLRERDPLHTYPPRPAPPK